MKPSTRANIYQFISAAFAVIVILSNILSAKMVKLPFSDFNIPLGVITCPLTFLLSDLVTEIYGAKKAKLMVYVALSMNVLSFLLIQMALILPNADNAQQTVFIAVLGLSGLRLFASLTAYIVAQLIDIQLYTLIWKWTGENALWLRSNGSTCASQIIDTVIVDIIYLFWGLGMSLYDVIPIIMISYAYKVCFGIIITPFFYAAVFFMKISKTRKVLNEYTM